MKIDAAISLLLALIAQSAQISAVISKAKDEGRDTLSADEWTSILDASDASTQRLRDAIAAAP